MTDPLDLDPMLVAEIAAQVCTERELQAIALYDRGTFGFRRVARQLGVSPSTARDLVESARRKVNAEIAKMEGAP
jgi:predicted DNA-binding protein (UPF0251 family)